MPAARPRSRRRPLVALVVLLAVVLVGVGWLVLGDDEGPDELAAVRGLPGVAAAGREDDDVLVRLRAGTGTQQAAAVLDRAPRDADRTTLRLGRAALEVEAGDAADAELLGAFVALAATRAPGGTLEIERRSPDHRVEVDVRRPEQAAPLAREIVARLTSPGGRVAGIDRVEVSLLGAPQAEAPPVVLRRLAGTNGRRQTAVLDAAIEVADRRPRVSTDGDDGELRPQARGLADAGVAWRQARAALDSRPAGRGDLRIYVDVAESGERRTILSGPASASPDRALALLRSFAGASSPFVATDLSYAQARAAGPRPARTVATAAAAAGVDRLSIAWPDPARGSASDEGGDDGGGNAAAGDAGGSVARIEDAPDVVLGLLPGIARASRLGIDEVEWTGNPGDDAVLRAAPPRRADRGTPLTDQPRVLRRYVRAIRAIGWRGPARLGLPLGRGTCDGYPGAQGVARIVSTATGRARSVEPVGSCTEDAAVRAARRGWDATAR